MRSSIRIHLFLFAAAIAALPLGSRAQSAALASGQVAGAEIQAWFDADGMAVGGLNLGNGCAFMAKGAPKRYQTVYCPGMDPFTVLGETKIVGNQLCSKFVYPDGSSYDACQDLFKVGDNKYEVRVYGVTRSILYRLVR